MSVNPTNSPNNNAAPAQESIAQKTRERRESFYRDEKNNIVGNNYEVPGGNFAHFLGYKTATPAELSGKEHVSSSRVIEIALQKDMQELGIMSAKNGNTYRNVAISWGRYSGEPGRERDMIKDGFDAIKQGPDKNSMEEKVAKAKSDDEVLGHSVAPYMKQLFAIQQQSRDDNQRYLELQYKFQEIGKQESTISNLMKVRNDAVTRAIRQNS